MCQHGADKGLVPVVVNCRYQSILVPADIEHRHGGSLEKRDLVWFNVDLMQQGVGGDNTWGAPVHSEYTISPIERSYTFIIRPLKAGDDEVKESKRVSFRK